MVSHKFVRLCKKTGLKIFVIFFTLLVITLLPILILLIGPIYLYRFILFKIQPMCRPDLGKMLTTRSTLYGVDDLYKNPHATLVVVMQVEGKAQLEVVRRATIERAICLKNSDGELARPELQMYIVRWLGFLFWKWDRNFDIMNHVNYWSNTEEPVDEIKLTEITRSLLKKPHHPKRPHWEFVIIRNYRAKKDPFPETPKSIIALRIHHSLADGYSLSKLLTTIAGTSTESFQNPHFIRPPWYLKAFDAFTFAIRLPFQILGQGIEGLDRNEWHLPEDKMTKHMQIAVTDRIPFESLRETKNMHKVTLTSVIMSAIAGGLRAYMLKTGVKIPDFFHSVLALPIKNHPSKLRNFMTACLVELPINKADPTERLQATNKRLENLKKSTVPTAFSMMMVLAGGLCNSLSKHAAKNSQATVILTNVPGPSEKIDFIEYPILDMHVTSGMLAGNTAIIVCVLSYNGAIKFVVEVDQAVMPTDQAAEELVSLIINEFDILANKV